MRRVRKRKKEATPRPRTRRPSPSASALAALACLGGLRSLQRLGLRGLFLGRRALGLRDAREHRVGIADVGDARPLGEIGELDRVADAERGDVELDVLGQIARQCLDRQLVRVLREDAAERLDALGLAHEHDRDGRLDRAVHAHLEQVEVLQRVAQRVQLHGLDDRVHRRLGAGHLDLEHRVAAARLAQRLAQMAALDRERERLAPVAVEHARDLARAAHGARAGRPTDLTCLDLEHDCLLACSWDGSRRP